MNGSNNWERICEEIQERSLKSESNLMTVANAQELRTRLFKCLNTANDEGILQTKLQNNDNETRGMRFHVHPGSDDVMIHSPPMSPLEILHLFLYGLIIPEKRRFSSSSFKLR